ncbi:MAG: N-acetyl-gamma-glutamyl-phosphate reductase, partial [Nanoarchaeota archaeon]
MKIGIIGASGYTGYELIKILSKRYEVELKVLNSQSSSGKGVREIYPDFLGKDKYTDYAIDEINNMKLDVIFLSMPNGSAMSIVPKLNCKIIDLSADYRFEDKNQYEDIYGIEHADKKRKAVYGLTEIFFDEIKKAELIANPGCYATASLLAIYPIQRFADYIVLDCKSGYSGAGKKASYVNEPKNYTDNIIPYNIVNHRHKAEIEQFVKTRLSFTPHVIPTFQGLMCTAHIILKKKISPENVKKIYIDFYNRKPFIKILDKIPN